MSGVRNLMSEVVYVPWLTRAVASSTSQSLLWDFTRE